MAKLSDLILRMAEVTGTPEPTVREIGRRLREAELISTGKGGRYGGAKMTPIDASRLLTALMVEKASACSLTEIVPLTKTYLTGLTSHSGRRSILSFGRWKAKLGLTELCQLKSGHTFEDAIAALITSMSNSSFENAIPKWGTVQINIELSDPKPDCRAQVTISTKKRGNFFLLYLSHQHARILRQTQVKGWSGIRTDTRSDLRARASVSEATLKFIGVALTTSGQPSAPDVADELE